MTIHKCVLFAICYFISGGLFGQSVVVATWNIGHFGKTKSEEEVQVMARVINSYDVVGIQEVTAKDIGGAQAVARLAAALNRMGDSWDYRISDPTRSSSGQISERYAYLWRKSKVTFLRAGLDTKLESTVEREPYWLEIEVEGMPGSLWLTSFHSRPFNRQPELEIQQMLDYPKRAGTTPLIMLGDWNLDEAHPVWMPFYRADYIPAVLSTQTTLKKSCKDGNYLNHSIDNIYFPADKLRLLKSGVTDFVNGNCLDLPLLRGVSDHLPVWIEVELVDGI